MAPPLGVYGRERATGDLGIQTLHRMTTTTTQEG